METNYFMESFHANFKVGIGHLKKTGILNIIFDAYKCYCVIHVTIILIFPLNEQSLSNVIRNLTLLNKFG